jgi:uncharacterized protein
MSKAMKDSAFRLNLHELPRRAGEMREYQLDFPLVERIGTPLIGIEKGEHVKLSIRAEAVDDGILITGSIASKVKGECGRCLTEIESAIDQSFQELYFYESRKPEDDELDFFVMDSDIADLEMAARDAVILALPINPLCRPDCRGLCSICGEKWENLPEGHSHETIDPRWSGLAGWKG